jgi:putative Ca2+/H+ antiporter (TMEM165/GDT1 family)
MSVQQAFRPSITIGPSITVHRLQHTSLLASCSQENGAQDDDAPLIFPANAGRKNESEQKSSLRSRAMTGLSAAVAMAAVAALAFPSVGRAIDVASISGGAGALATSTNSFLASVGETGFYQAFTLVFLSEIGDKTFFIAGLLAMKTSRLISFVGSMGALAVMTVISVIIGQVFHAVPAGIADGIPLDDLAAVLAFAFFGFKTLKEALDMEAGSSVMDEELAEAEEEVEANDASKQATTIARVLSIFGLVFAAEFGDRSFLSTIALSAAQNPVSVAIGATAAHAVATGIAVAGGAVVAKYLSEKVIGIIGGTLFLVFAATTAFGIF